MQQTVVTEPKVSEFDVSVATNEKIVRFEVTMSDAALMQIFESLHNFRGVETRHLLVEIIHRLQQRVHVSSGHVLHHHVQMSLRLETVVEVDNEGVLTASSLQRVQTRHRHNITLTLDTVNLLLANHVHFTQHFNGIQVTRSFLARQINFAKGTLCNWLQDFEIFA